MATNKINPTQIDEENPEWTAADFKKARPASKVLREILPEQTAAKMLAQSQAEF